MTIIFLFFSISHTHKVLNIFASEGVEHLVYVDHVSLLTILGDFL